MKASSNSNGETKRGREGGTQTVSFYAAAKNIQTCNNGSTCRTTF